MGTDWMLLGWQRWAILSDVMPEAVSELELRPEVPRQGRPQGHWW